MLFILSRPTLTYILHLFSYVSDIILKVRFLGQRKFRFLEKKDRKIYKKGQIRLTWVEKQLNNHTWTACIRVLVNFMQILIL